MEGRGGGGFEQGMEMDGTQTAKFQNTTDPSKHQQNKTTKQVVAIEDAFEDDEDAHIVMELCRGGELLHRIGRRAYGERTVASFMRAVLRTLAQCHAKRILHRDVKPGNFMLLDESDGAPLKAIGARAAFFGEQAGREGCPPPAEPAAARCGFSAATQPNACTAYPNSHCLTHHLDHRNDNDNANANIKLNKDFGLAVFFDPKALPRTDLGLEGTPWFMAPEALASAVEPASDVWAAGVMAYQVRCVVLGVCAGVQGGLAWFGRRCEVWCLPV